MAAPGSSRPAPGPTRLRPVAELARRRLGAQSLAGQARAQRGARRRGCEDCGNGWGRRYRGVQSRGPATRRRKLDGRRAPPGGERSRRPSGGAVRWRHPFRAGRAQGAWSRCPRLPRRPGLSLRSRGRWRERVRKALDIIRDELEVAMTLTGTRDIREVSADVLA